jgi:hypothetical protein
MGIARPRLGMAASGMGVGMAGRRRRWRSDRWRWDQLLALGSDRLGLGESLGLLT